MLLPDKTVNRLSEESGKTRTDVNNLIKQLSKQVMERALEGELTYHLNIFKV